MGAITRLSIAPEAANGSSDLDTLNLDVLSSAVKPLADARQSPSVIGESLPIAIIDDRRLIRDCFGRSLAMIEPGLDVKYFSDPDAFAKADPEEVDQVRVVLLCVMWSSSRSDLYFSQIAQIKSARPSANVILLSDIDKLDDILRAIESGARGYIPTNVSLEVAVKAMQLVAAGGAYVPASLLFWSDRITKQVSQKSRQQQTDTIFTSRQLSVMEALRRGKPNKIIAYELNMCESTVKVHIRNIMKRLKAKNRTEAAYILTNMKHQNETPVSH